MQTALTIMGLVEAVQSPYHCVYLRQELRRFSNKDPMSTYRFSTYRFTARCLLAAAASLSASIILSACSAAGGKFLPSTIFSSGSKYLESGTVILSHQMPAKPSPLAKLSRPISAEEHEDGTLHPLAPLVGYFPPAVTYLPAENETWLEINRQNKVLTLYKGKGVIKEIHGEGDVSITPGDYYLQHKQKAPLWYAPNEYFAKRQLNVPPPSDRLRYRRGALGKFALFPTTTFPIHCAPIWTQEVGGIRVSANDLSSIYYMLPVGAPIVVK